LGSVRIDSQGPGNEIRMGNGIRARSSVPLRVIRFGPFEFQPDTGELRKHGLRLKLRGQPIELLTMLLQRPGEPVTREELQRRLRPADTYVDFEHSLNAAMKRLRAALGDSADAPRFIETLAGRGYRFIAPVSQPAEDEGAGRSHICGAVANVRQMINLRVAQANKG
jgi:DNA-binding winged helix-turn-helix (wHTH) protein